MANGYGGRKPPRPTRAELQAGVDFLQAFTRPRNKYVRPCHKCTLPIEIGEPIVWEHGVIHERCAVRRVPSSIDAEELIRGSQD